MDRGEQTNQRRSLSLQRQRAAIRPIAKLAVTIAATRSAVAGATGPEPLMTRKHQNSILAIAKGQVPVGASNNLSVDSAVDKGQIQRSDLVVLQKSPGNRNGPFAVSPKLDQRAVDKLTTAMGSFSDPATLKAMELVGPLIPVTSSAYDFVRQAAKTINLDEKGNPKPIGE